MSRFRALLSALGSRLAIDPEIAGFRPSKRADMANNDGAVGTLNFEGYLTDLGEYNEQFQVNTEAFKAYEQMRRGDPQVYALLTALGLPIRSARWDVVEPEQNAQQTEKEAAALVRDMLLGGLEYTSPAGITVSQSFDSVLQHALLMLPFGASAMEEIYAIDGDTVRLQRLAPRMPSTYYRWHVDDDGETLLVLEQLAYRGPNLQFWKIPADKLTLFSFQQEGAYFAGRSMLRAVYKPWYFKSGLEKIESIAAERNGMGVPVGIHAPNASQEDRKLFNQWVTAVAVHEATGFALPNGADFKLVGVAGKTFDCSVAINRYAQEITRAGLASFLDLGTTQTGARAVGDTLSNFFYLSEQSLAESIAWNLNINAVRRIVDLNYPGVFGRGKARYPRLVAANVQSRSIIAVIEYLDKLATAGVIRPDDALEDRIREELGFPARDLKSQRLVGQGKVQERIDNNAPGAVAAPKKTPGAVGPQIAQQTGEEEAQMSAAGVEWQGLQLKRAPRGAERFVQLSDVVTHLDGGKAEIASLLRAAKRPMLQKLAAKMAKAKTYEAHRVSLPLDTYLADDVKDHLRRVYRFGRATVQHERKAQRNGAVPAAPQTEKVTASAVLLSDADDQQLQLLADTTVGQFQNNLTARAAATALKAKRKGEAAPQQIADEVDGQPDGWIDRTANEAANNAMSSGRQDEFNQVRDQIDRFLYSALLDENTCGPCGDADGKEGSEADIPAVPNPDCAGSDQCRCMWVAVFKDEGSNA